MLDFLNGTIRAHPRSRGEHGTFGELRGYKPGSSPLTRGAPITRIDDDVVHGLIPAHAGSTSCFACFSYFRGAHPRSRGEHYAARLLISPVEGSSPLTRGAPRSPSLAASRTGLIPAHAGSTADKTLQSMQRAAHPRSRGEHAILRGRGPRAPGSSPLTRGAPNR